jgi:hypothetical protein
MEGDNEQQSLALPGSGTLSKAHAEMWNSDRTHICGWGHVQAKLEWRDGIQILAVNSDDLTPIS